MVNIKAAHKLLNLIYPNFIERNGVVLLAEEAPSKEIVLDGFHDSTAIEAFYNHIHILDHFRHSADLDGENPQGKFYDSNHADFKLACEIGKKVARIWADKLKQEFPEYRFRIYYTQEDNPTVRFHRVREGESNWLEEKDWAKDVAEGKVLVIETDKLITKDDA